MANSDWLEAHLWDLRAHAEAKLRQLARVQQLLTEHGSATNPADRAKKRIEIIDGLSEIVAISAALRATAEEARDAAKALP